MLDENKDKYLNDTSSKSFFDRDFVARQKLGKDPLHPSFTLNNIAYESEELKDPNDLFKKVCSLMQKRPPACRNLTLVNTK